MIRINLIPPELRTKTKGQSVIQDIKIPLEIIAGGGIALFLLLLVAHSVLLGLTFHNNAQLKTLNNRMAQIQPEQDRVNGLIERLKDLEERHHSFNALIGTGGIRWSQKLNVLSDQMPRGVWLKRIALLDGIFYIEGSAISRGNHEMQTVLQLVADLNRDADFSKQLKNIELESFQAKKVDKTEVVDFLVTATYVRSN